MPERQPGLQGAAAAAPALLGSPDSASAAADAGGGGGGGGAISARSSCSAAWDALRMASPALAQQPPPQPQPQPALAEARRWIEQVTGKTFGDKHFRSGLENGVLLCELLNSILPGSVTKINRSSTPIAGLDNIALFLRGCREVGLKESQLFDPGDLQETTGRTTTKNLDGSRKLKNVLVTIYWLGKTANNSAHFNGPPLNLKEFEGLLTQMRKDTEDVESPKRSIRDSGYVDCWDSERSDSLSPPRHGRDDSFDSLDSFGSRSQQTPSPDVVLRGSSDGRGSDSESDLPHRKLPDVKKDDMSARRTSYSEPKSVVPFNQYLPNKSNQTAYIPAPLRKKKAEREDFRKSWSTMSSPLGGERPFSKQHPETIEEEPLVPLDGDLASSRMTSSCPSAKPMRTDMGPKNPWPQFLTCSENQTIAPQNEEKGPEEIGKLRRLEQAGIKVRPAAQRCGGSPKPASQGDELTPDIVLHQENPFMWWRPQNDTGSEEDEDGRIPDLEKDDFAVRRARLNRREAALPFTHFFLPPSAKKDRNRREERKIHTKNQERPSGKKILVTSAKPEMPGEDQPSWQDEGKAQIPDIQSHGLAKKPTHARPSQAAFLSCGKASITPKDKEIWDRLKVSGETSEISLPDSDGCKSSVRDVCADAQQQRSSSLSEWQENSEEESDDRFPDLERDDMMVRRFGTFPKPINPLIPANRLATCNAPLKRQGNVVGQREPKLQPKAEKPERNLSRLCAAQPGHGAPSFLISKDRKEQKNATESEKVAFQNPEKEDPTLRSSEALSRQAESSVFQLVPVCFSKQNKREEKFLRPEQQLKSVLVTVSVGAEQFCGELSQSHATQPAYTPEHKRRSAAGLAQEDVRSVVDQKISGARVIPPERPKHLEINSKQLATVEAGPLQISGCRTPVSDDTESVSMFDMRCPDEGAVNQPHSKDRHEKLQIVHHQLKEDEDQWQDDLARWKNRRRSASQDLLKKEAERKKMEQLLIGGEGSNERRKSIKTYREIVEEKEKRERELHEAYKNARSQEEADRILQHYIERFTISEAVLERLEMPKLLERSHSVEPNSSSPSKDPNPLRYLRQQSLPPPKFTAKFEATIIPTNGSEASTSTGSPTSSRPSGSMAMPLVTPKPYSQPRETREILRNFKVDGKISVNGEASNGVDDEPDKDCSAFLFEPSPTLSTKSDHVVKSHGGSTEGSTNSTTPEPVQKSLIEHAVHREKVDSFTEEVDTACRKDRTELKEKFLVDPDLMEPSVTFSCANLLAADVEISSFHNHSNETESHPELNSTQEAKALERGEEKEKDASVSQKVQIDTSQAPKPGEDLPISLLKKLPETNHGVLLETPLQDQKAAAENRDASNRSTCWSWDPEEERRRQERWQQEQERLLQERKILEDTVVPFMLASGSTEPLSTSSSLTDGNRTMNLIDLSYSEDDKKPNEEAKLKSLFYEQDGANYKECQPREENTSTVNKEEYPEGLNWRQKEQVPTPGDKSPKDMALPLRPEVLWNQPLPADRSPGISDIRQKDSPVGYNLGQPASSPKEVKRAASQGSSGTGPSSPRSPTVQSQSSNRSISGKKLCSSCGLPLGKGAAMIIESLGLYFHIQCFRVGVSRPGGGLD
ncbi:LIM and calponin homology domains-containing protein 1 isoform X3 [Ahaetulla prasina]|uniref:LIM and calponin homology domains-containing protein 1 isoform X3 n=1 Tax=Ahaetulla prasina TaxID=499056 RepID=UPI00264911E3|nr:LIM and calponin homology domains-containing protein 1 isoform X3 [Ahaetulla prasina]